MLKKTLMPCRACPIGFGLYWLEGRDVYMNNLMACSHLYTSLMCGLVILRLLRIYCKHSHNCILITDFCRAKNVKPPKPFFSSQMILSSHCNWCVHNKAYEKNKAYAKAYALFLHTKLQELQLLKKLRASSDHTCFHTLLMRCSVTVAFWKELTLN